MKKQTFEEFKKEVNRKRKESGWYQHIAEVQGKEVKLKGYKTWLQVFRIDGMDCSSPMEMKVRDFNKWLERVK